MRPDFRRLPMPLTPLAIAISMIGATGGAQAQSAGTSAADDSSAVQRVEVTARRRLETQFDVPASVSAISGSDLKAAGIDDIQGMISLVPNANMTENPNRLDTYISIRGMRQADVGAPPNFGMYRNGIFAGGHRVNLGSQVDVARFEIVRGPQGGLYGREAVGGAANIVYVMPKAGDKLNGYGTAALESDSRTRLEGALTLPINDQVATRATVWATEQKKGEYYNIVLKEQIDRNSSEGLRLGAAAQLAPFWSMLGTVEYQKAKGPSQRSYAPNGIANGSKARSAPETPSTVSQDTPSRNDVEQSYASAKISYTPPAGTLTLVASVREYKLNGTQDQDQTAVPLNAGPLTLQQVLQRQENIKQSYAELLWESDPAQALTWRTGVSYFHETFGTGRYISTNLDTGQLGALGIPNVGVINGAAGIPNAGSSTGTDSYSVFGDLRYELSKQLALTATLRYTKDKVKLDWSQGIDPSSSAIGKLLFAGVVPTFALHSKDTYSFTSPAVGAEYKLNSDANLYLQYSTGYRPGGYNTSVTNPLYIPYGQESSRNYEAGIKLRFLGGRAGLNLTVFRMDQDDLTVQQDDPGDSQFGFTYLSNVGKARTKGFELEAMARPIPSVGLSFSVGYLDAKYTQGRINAGTASETDVSGRVLQGVRPWTINARSDLRLPLAGSMDFYGALGVRREIGGAIGDLSDYALQATTMIDLNAGLDFSKRTQLSAFVRNATDEKVVQFRFANGAVGTNLGRRYGLQLTHQF